MIKKYKLTRLSSTGSLTKAVDEARFIINYRNQLNPAQYDAAAAVEGAYLIIAGAGTGKTRTLVFRVARLIELGYDPRSILLLTFTRKAAKEMMDRAALLLDNRCTNVNGGTFHSFANITLRKYSKAIGLVPNFTILDQGDSEDVVNLIRSQSGLAGKEKRFPNKQTLVKVYSLHVNTGKSIEAIIETDYPHFLRDIEKILMIQQLYTAYKRKNNILDYDDLLLFLRDFLNSRSPAAMNFISNINFVMVDEYQDTNKLQAEIVKGLTQLKKNIMVVGDDSQAIYSFRGANFKNIMEFPLLFDDVKVIKLEENYRSTQPILDFTNFIIENAVEKYEKHLFTRRQTGELPVIIAATTIELQSKFIVERILELSEEGVSLNEIAVLFRSSFHSFDLEIELNKASIPFIKYGGMKFVETAHIKDVLAFLRIAANPQDVVSWYRILLLHEGIGQVTARKIIEDISSLNITFNVNPEAMISKRYKDSIVSLFQLLFNLHTQKFSPTEKTELVLEYYLPLFKNKYDDFHKRKKDLDILVNITENYRSLDSLLADMALDPPRDSVVDIEGESKENEFLTLSTIHSAKGLEWHSVFIIHAVDGCFPISKSAETLETIEEERRLMYVASTRAKQNLYITYPMNIFDRESGRTFSKPSRFIANVDENLIEGWLLDENQ